MNAWLPDPRTWLFSDEEAITVPQSQSSNTSFITSDTSEPRISTIRDLKRSGEVQPPVTSLQRPATISSQAMSHMIVPNNSSSVSQTALKEGKEMPAEAKPEDSMSSCSDLMTNHKSKNIRFTQLTEIPMKERNPSHLETLTLEDHPLSKNPAPAILQTTRIEKRLRLEINGKSKDDSSLLKTTSERSEDSPLTPLSPTSEFLKNAHRHQRRRRSIADTVIDSSLGPSLLGVSSELAKSLMTIDVNRDACHTRFHATRCSMSTREELCLLACRRKSLLPFIRLHMPQPHSWTLHRTDSMVSLCYRSLATYIAEDNLQGLQGFLEIKRIAIDDRDENGSTALIYASSKGKIQFVRELINHGADVNAEDADNWTALLCAAKEGHTDVCLELLDHGADLEHRDMGGWTALMWATYKGRLVTVKFLLSRGADVHAHGNYHISSLLWASGRGYIDIVRELIAYGAKVNVGDKYGTTALVWASRKGNLEIVDVLLKAGANVDTAGMYSWTALIVAALGNHVDTVMLLVEHKPNVNALDKDGNTALAIASREGYHEIVSALLNAGAYINIQDRNGDTNLIHAVKGGHRSVVEALLKKYVDVDVAGKDRKTATYIAVEKGNVVTLKMLLNANPDLEIPTKDGDTPLLRAVRSRNAEIVQLLLDKKAKVSATDKKGDSVLHIAMRARSKAIVEILLRNPKNSQLLYRPNRQGETPYNIDIKHPKTILGQIFGARRLNTNEDNENMLGYDLYSSALADILSEPSLSTPITVGLYAKWGSGKSFLLNKLREEMKNFARQWIDPTFQFSSLLFCSTSHVSLFLGVMLGLALQSWLIGVIFGGALFCTVYICLMLVWYANKKYDWYWPYTFTVALTKKLNSFKLLLQIIFCHPPGGRISTDPSEITTTIQPIKFYFTDQTRVGTTTAGENAVVQMVGSLYDSIENDFGSLATRLYRAFRPKPVKSTTSWTWRHLCCLPYIVIFEFCFLSLLIGISTLTIHLLDLNHKPRPPFTINTNSSSLNDSLPLLNPKPDEAIIDPVTAYIIMGTVGLILAFSIIANLYTWSRIFHSLLFSQRRHLHRTIAKLDSLKSEGFIQTLRAEVHLMTEMVKCLDSFTAQQSRLVLIVDGLDSCEQDKVLLVLDAMQALFSDNHCPFLIILAIDPHIIAKAVELNSRRIFAESNIGGHDYLRNMVHLPFYLQNSGLRKVKVAQQTAQLVKKTGGSWNYESACGDDNYATTSATIQHSISNRRLSTESSVIMNSNEKLKPPSRKGSRKMRLSESIASSIGSNLNRLGGAQDLNKMLLTDDYFSDVNPRSMRRLMNVVYVTGRLLKAFQIDFNWYHLASWINITEQWPFRTSWLILYYDMYEENYDDSTSLKTLYDKVRPQIPVLKDAQPLLEMDRDERKLDVFLTFHRSSLLVSDMKIFLPFTINLDPYIKKKIKEEQQGIEEDPLHQNILLNNGGLLLNNPWQGNPMTSGTLTNRHGRLTKMPSLQGSGVLQSAIPSIPNHPALNPWPIIPPVYNWMPGYQAKPPMAGNSLPSELLDVRLSKASVQDVCNFLGRIEELNPANVEVYKNIIRENNVNGKVLLYCEISELKEVLKMTFGDWELFRMLVTTLREHEMKILTGTQDEGPRSVRFTVGSEHSGHKDGQRVESHGNIQRGSMHADKVEKSASRTDGPSRRDQAKHSVMEKQVTLEEQMICGALQTLNEEACEDVLDVPSPSAVQPDSLAGADRPRSLSFSRAPDTDYVLLQPSPIFHWAPVPDEPESSDESSHDSLVHLQRTNSQRSVTSQLSIESDRRVKAKTRPRSILVSPPSSPRPQGSRPSEDNLSKTITKTIITCSNSNNSLSGRPGRPSMSRIDENVDRIEINVTVPSPENPQDSDELSNIVINDLQSLNDESDDESTPLVSQISSPVNANSSNAKPQIISNSFIGRHQLTSSSLAVKSPPQTGDNGENFISDSSDDSVGLAIRETLEGRLSRQNAEDWDSPETPV